MTEASVRKKIEKYLKIKNPDNIIALNKLRNAIAHINYGLRYKDRSSNILWQFFLKPRSRYLVRKGRKSIYPSNNIVVNPFIFHERFESAIIRLNKQLLNRKNKELRKSFNGSVKRKHWVIIY